MSASVRATGLALCTLLLAVLAVPAHAGGPADEVFWRINEARTERGLAPLARFPTSSQAVAANDDYAATQEAHRLHTANWDFYRGYGANAYAENQGMGTSMSPRQIVAAWIGSPGHADNLFSPAATHLAVAATSASGWSVYTAHMLTASSVDASDPGPRPPAPAPEPEPEPEEPEEPEEDGSRDDGSGSGGGSADDGDGSGSNTAPTDGRDGGTSPDDEQVALEAEAPADEVEHDEPPTLPDPMDRAELARVNEIDMAVATVDDDPGHDIAPVDEDALLEANLVDMDVEPLTAGVTGRRAGGTPVETVATVLVVLAAAGVVLDHRRRTTPRRPR